MQWKTFFKGIHQVFCSMLQWFAESWRPESRPLCLCNRLSFTKYGIVFVLCIIVWGNKVRNTSSPQTANSILTPFFAFFSNYLFYFEFFFESRGLPDQKWPEPHSPTYCLAMRYSMHSWFSVGGLCRCHLQAPCSASFPRRGNSRRGTNQYFHCVGWLCEA